MIEHIKTYVSPDKKPVYNIDNAFTPAFIDYFCKTYGISHYIYDINKVCFMKYVHKNQNHRAKVPEQKIKTSLLELDEVKNYYKDDDDKYKTII